ncbi:MAG TPA: HigA family addiction module antitoxin [Bryobacteraceae bacterium]
MQTFASWCYARSTELLYRVGDICGSTERTASNLPTTTEWKERKAMKETKRLAPIKPGEMLREVLAEAGLTANAAALKMRIPNNRLSGILNGQRAITPDTALRLARLFGTSAEMWLNLQFKYDLETAEDELAERIAREVETLSGEAA